MTLKPDKITVYSLDVHAVPPSTRVRWKRRSAYNGNLIAASTEGYARVRGAIDNIQRTQREPYLIEVERNGS